MECEEYFKHINQEVSEEIKKFVDEGVFGNSEYLFITKEDGKNIGYCSKCKEEYEVEDVKHNTRGQCPICGATVTAKLTRYRRKNCFNQSCFYYFQKSIIDPEVIVCKGYYVTRDYQKDYRNPVTDYTLEAIYLFDNKGGKFLKRYYGNYYGEHWEEKKSVFDFNQGWFGPMMCHISRDSIHEATKGTRFQYIPKELLKGYYSTVNVFDEFAKYPWLEQLYKMGFEGIVEAKLRGSYLYSCLNYRGKDIFKILRLKRNDVKELVNSKKDITPLLLKVYQLQSKFKTGLSVSDIYNIANDYGHEFARFSDVLKYTTMMKAVKYMGKQYEKYKKRYYSKDSVLRTWYDYIENCIELDMNLKSEHVLFPKDVYTAHQNAMKQVTVRADKILNEKIERRAKGLNDKYCFEYKGLVLRAAESTEELITEGKALHHCVATNYTKPYAKGETGIFFIRKVSEPDKPYFTMEIKNEKIIQTHGKGNCLPDNTVAEFINAFRAAKLQAKPEKVRIPA